MDDFKTSLIVTLVVTSLAAFFFGLGEFSSSLITDSKFHYGYFERCFRGECDMIPFNISLALNLIGFILSIHSALFSLFTIILQNRIPRKDHFKLIIAVLIYNSISIVFMVSGWNELRLYVKEFSHKEGWSYIMLIIGYVLCFLSYLPILYSIIRAYRHI